MTVFVYQIFCVITKRSYIGITKNLSSRFKQHSGADSIIGRAIRKYGKENFEFIVLENCSSYKDAGRFEKLYIQENNTLVPNGYNLAEGGHGGSTFHSRESIKRCLQTKKENGTLAHSEETKAKMRGQRIPREFRLCLLPGCSIVFEVPITNKKKFCCFEHAKKGQKRLGAPGLKGYKQSREHTTKRIKHRKRTLENRRKED